MSDQQSDFNHEGDLAVEEATPKLKPPKKYRVVLMNDDYTPMEFVVQILFDIFPGVSNLSCEFFYCR